MKLETALLTMIIVCLGSSLILAQSPGLGEVTNAGQKMEHFERPKAPPGATNWGKSIEGVRLSMTTTNSVFESGASTSVLCVISNSSTNVIFLVSTSLPQDYELLLVNDAGRSYHVILPTVVWKSTRIELPPGEVDVRNLAVTFRRAIEAGYFTLTAARQFSADGRSWIKLQSSPLRIQIK